MVMKMEMGVIERTRKVALEKMKEDSNGEVGGTMLKR